MKLLGEEFFEILMCFALAMAVFLRTVKKFVEGEL